MTASLAHIRRHPIKSAGGEGLDAVTLAPARRLPGDRAYAVLTEAGERLASVTEDAAGQPNRWLPKSCFLRGVVAPGLQAVTGGGEGRLRLSHPDLPDLEFDPETEGARLIAWLSPLWPDGRGAPTRLVHGPGIWTDQKWPWVSILSLASLAQLESDLGMTLGLHRWRGNLWVDGWDAFAERDMIGRIIRIGDVELRVTEPIGRCNATDANTDTGQVEIDMPKALDRLYGAQNFGVFAEVVSGGPIAIGDPVML